VVATTLPTEGGARPAGDGSEALGHAWLRTQAVGMARLGGDRHGVLGHARSGAGCGFRPAVGTGGRSTLYGAGVRVAALPWLTVPAGDGALTCGPWRGKQRPTGGTPGRIISELKTLPNENS
jgi:hypothetical protein